MLFNLKLKNILSSKINNALFWNYISLIFLGLSGLGLNVIIGSTIYDSYGHFSSTDINREKDFQNAIDDNKIKAIWCARGGYGAMRIIDNINSLSSQKLSILIC